MPESGKYAKVPRPESVDTFIRYLEGNPRVVEVERPGEQVIIVRRETIGSIKVYMTNIYCVSEADVYEITSTEAGLAAIVTMSAWNGYTKTAKALCRGMNIGLF